MSFSLALVLIRLPFDRSYMISYCRSTMFLSCIFFQDTATYWRMSQFFGTPFVFGAPIKVTESEFHRDVCFEKLDAGLPDGKGLIIFSYFCSLTFSILSSRTLD